ncbi:MAG: diadenylate cyclase [Cyanobacteria bacterium REEB67]|nr:diadenylate cyclase [Cyanobacteria bacterium REEB67]
MLHSYPKDLAKLVIKSWNENKVQSAEPTEAEYGTPDQALLETLLSTCYQASLLREETRPIHFRIVFADPESFPVDGGPPFGFHRLEFGTCLPLTAQGLRRLSSAANFPRSLIGVRINKETGPEIWGILHSGPRWLQVLHGGRASSQTLPNVLVVIATGPGNIEVKRGATSLGQLCDGRVFGPSMNVFQARWLQDTLSDVRAERLEIHERSRSEEGAEWAALDPGLTEVIDKHMMKRMIAAVRAFEHGGTLVLLPPNEAAEICHNRDTVSIKYEFAEGEPRARFRTLILSVMKTLAEIGGKKSANSTVGWDDYQRSNDSRISSLDEAIFEVSHLIAALSTADGAVVLTKRFELLGFGAEIHCYASEVDIVAHALDLEGGRVRLESTQNVGTRHRAAYRLSHALPDALVIVISQDGAVQFVKWKNNHVTYWEHQASFSFSTI